MSHVVGLTEVSRSKGYFSQRGVSSPVKHSYVSGCCISPFAPSAVCSFLRLLPVNRDETPAFSNNFILYPQQRFRATNARRAGQRQYRQPHATGHGLERGKRAGSQETGYRRAYRGNVNGGEQLQIWAEGEARQPSIPQASRVHPGLLLGKLDGLEQSCSYRGV